MTRRTAAGTDTPSFHDEVLVPAQRTALRALGSLTSDAGLYLAGGTSLALRLGHRRSVDLNWFGAEVDPDELSARLAAARPPVAVRETAHGTLHAEIEGLHVSFLAYPYPLVRPRVRWPTYGCDLGSLVDIGCMKLATVAQRGLFRDFVDLHGIVHTGLSLQTLLTAYQEKYATDEVAHILHALTYFEDADREPRPDLVRKVDWHGVQRDFEAWVRELDV